MMEYGPDGIIFFHVNPTVVELRMQICRSVQFVGCWNEITLLHMI